MAEPMEPLRPPSPRSGAKRGRLLVAVVVGLLVVGIYMTGVDDAPTTTPAPPADAAAARCAEQWDRARAETDLGTADDTELRRTFTACPDFPTWRREHDRTDHGRYDLTLRAGCIVLGSAPVCDDARARGVLD